MKIIERKHKEAVDKLTAQRLRRANQEKARRRPIRARPTPTPSRPAPALPFTLDPKANPVGWLAGPPARGCGASLPRRGGGRRGRRDPAAALGPRPAAQHLQQRHAQAQARVGANSAVLRGQEIDMRAASNAPRGRHAPHQPLRHARGLRQRSGRSCAAGREGAAFGAPAQKWKGGRFLSGSIMWAQLVCVQRGVRRW